MQTLIQFLYWNDVSLIMMFAFVLIFGAAIYMLRQEMFKEEGNNEDYRDNLVDLIVQYLYLIKINCKESEENYVDALISLYAEKNVYLTVEEMEEDYTIVKNVFDNKEDLEVLNQLNINKIQTEV